MSLSNIAHYGFLVFIFLLPFQTVFLLRESFIDGEKWQYGTIGVYGVDILLMVILGLTLVQWRGSIKYVWLLLLILWAGLSVFWATDQVLASSFFVKLLLASVIFFLASLSDGVKIRQIIFVLLVAGVVQSGIGIAQFLSQQSWDSTLLGMSTHPVFQAGSSVLKIDDGRFLRAYGTFPHPNMLGGFLAVVLVLGLSYATFVRKQGASGEREESKYHLSLIPYPLSSATYLSSLIIILLGLILSFSRTAWLGALLGIGVIGLYAFRRPDRQVTRGFLKILLALGLASLVFGSILHDQVFPRFDRETIEREGSVSERVQSLRDASMIIGEGNVLLGTGAGNFTTEMIRRQPERPVWGIQPAHNVFVLVLAELGVVGLLLFGIFVYSLFWGSQQRTVVMTAVLLVLVPSLLLDHWLWSSHFGLFFLFLLLGLAQSRDEESL